MITLLLLVFSLSSAEAAYRDGDIIFHESQSAQSHAIREATGSRWSHVGVLFQERGRWMVFEAVQPVRLTPLNSFIQRGKSKEYRVYRLPTLSDSQREELRKEAGKYLGKSYDIYFEWSDELIYCSELVYKMFLSATAVEIGAIQRFGDLRLEGPYAKELIRRRLTDKGRELDLGEPIVTPDSQIKDPDLILVEQQPTLTHFPSP